MGDQDNKNTIGLKPVPTYRVSEAIYEQIREKILSGELKIGDRLPSERALVDIFHRSRPTIREALRMLERSGLIEISPGTQGGVVKKISSASVRQPLENMIILKQISIMELDEYRCATETTYAQWAAEKRTEEDIKKMKAILKQMESCLDDFFSIQEFDVEFHKAIVDAGRNGVAKIMHRVISKPIIDFIFKEYERLSYERRIIHNQTIVADLRKILDAIISQDAEKSRLAMADHLKGFIQIYNDKL